MYGHKRLKRYCQAGSFVLDDSGSLTYCMDENDRRQSTMTSRPRRPYRCPSVCASARPPRFLNLSDCQRCIEQGIGFARNKKLGSERTAPSRRN